MAEGWTRQLKGDCIDAYSAGIETHGLNPHAVEVMAEAGVDITAQQSENIKDFADQKLDVAGMPMRPAPYFLRIAEWFTLVSRIRPDWRGNWLRQVPRKKINSIATARSEMKSRHSWRHFQAALSKAVEKLFPNSVGN